MQMQSFRRTIPAEGMKSEYSFYAQQHHVLMKKNEKICSNEQFIFFMVESERTQFYLKVSFASLRQQ